MADGPIWWPKPPGRPTGSPAPYWNLELGDLVTSNNQFGFKKQLIPMHFPFFIFRLLCDFKDGQKCKPCTSHFLSYTIISSIGKFSRGLKPPPLISQTKNFSPRNLAYNMYHEFNHSCHLPAISQSNHSNFTKISPFESEKLTILLGKQA